MQARRGALVLLVVLSCASPLAADPPTARARADEVLEAVRRDDDEALRALSALERPDPWIVVDLLIDDDPDAARRYVHAGRRPDLEALPAYIEYRKTHPVGADIRAALAAAAGANSPQTGQVALDLLEGLGTLDDGFFAARVAIQRAGILGAFRRNAEAAEACIQAAEAAEAVGWLRGAEQGYYDAGMFAHRSRDFPVMLRAWQLLPALQRRRQDAAGEALALRFLGNVHAELGELDVAEPLLEASYERFKSLGSVDGQLSTIENQGVVRLRRGDYDGAQRAFDEALDLAKGGTPATRARLLVQLSGVYMAIGDDQRLLEVGKEARALAPSDQPALVAMSEGTIGIALKRLGKLDDAEAHLKTALQTFERMNDPQGTVRALHNLANVYEDRGDYDTAAALREKGLTQARAIPDPWLIASALNDLAHTETLRGNVDVALTHASESLELARTLVSPLLEMQAWRERLRALMAKGDTMAAVPAAHEAIGRLGTIIQGLGERQGAEARGEHTELFERAILAAVKAEDTEAAFAFMEASRAGSLLESLEGRGELRRAFVPDALRDAETQARRQVTSAAQAYRAAPRQTKRDELRRLRGALESARTQLVDVIEKIQREAKAGAAIAYPEPAPLEDVQAALGADDALVIYALLESEAVALVVTSEQARIVRLGSKDEIETACRQVSEAAQDARKDTTKPLATLRELVAEPLGIDAKRVLLAPDGALFSVPLHLAFGDRPAAYVASGTTLALLSKARTARGEGVLAFGDPDYSNRGEKERMAQLASSGAEATDVGDVVRLGKQATEAELRELLPSRKRWRAVHLACHGVLHRRPLFSALALTASPPDDGDLTVIEAFQMDVPSDLVVLSACETGVGTVFPGEGLVGLTRAFLYAGAPRVIVSLWKVDDEATHALMVKFHELWKKGTSAAVALEQAQNHVRTHPDHDWEHPYYWGAWVLWGLTD